MNNTHPGYQIKFYIHGQRADRGAPLHVEASPIMGTIYTPTMMSEPYQTAEKIAKHYACNMNADGLKVIDVGGTTRESALKHYGLYRKNVFVARLRQPRKRRVYVVVFYMNRAPESPVVPEPLVEAYIAEQHAELTVDERRALALDLTDMMLKEGYSGMFEGVANAHAELLRRISPAELRSYVATLMVSQKPQAVSVADVAAMVRRAEPTMDLITGAELVDDLVSIMTVERVSVLKAWALMLTRVGGPAGYPAHLVTLASRGAARGHSDVREALRPLWTGEPASPAPIVESAADRPAANIVSRLIASLTETLAALDTHLNDDAKRTGLPKSANCACYLNEVERAATVLADAAKARERGEL